MSQPMTLAEFTDVTDDDGQNVSAAREQALAGGARYRGRQQVTPDAGAAIGGETTCCQRCEASVTDRFQRVFGDTDNVAWGCLECYSGSAIKRGAAGSADCDGEVADGISTGSVTGGTNR